MSLLRSYDAFLFANASQITAVESSLRSLAFFLPGRFKDAELTAEALSASLNILGLYHDSILYRLVSSGSSPASSSSSPGLDSSSPARLAYTPSPHARYTTHFADSSPAYNLCARALVLVGYTELLAEMLARRRGGRKRAWDVVVGIEGVKVALRLALLRLTKMRPTIQPPIPEREVDPALLEDLPASGTASPTQWRGARTGLSRPTLASLKAPPATPASGIAGPTRARLAAGSRSGRSAASEFDSDSDSDDTLVESLTEKDVNDYLLSKTLKPADVRSPTELVRPVSSREGLLAEGIWIARPFAYALALRKYGRKALLPFFLSLLLELLARTLRQRSLALASGPRTNPLLLALSGGNPLLGLVTAFLGGAPTNQAVSDVEAAEWKRRGRAFWWYLLRGPAWDGWTKPKLEGLARATENRTLLGIVGGIVRDHIPLVDEYHFYSAT
ncbi:peroxisome membrane protein [Tilletiopsis washingtonensis]|uniref:Peroxisomal membrane protein PEX16 n=1 Tax=Tilletiopsis washingtonensis TaxID=58919 RepID=A0A316ZF78_9BASI|nr:peroxisome membrane protein [Tilletiopsis washingtonensis]PWO00401.1 peroxisome membrane protein [Tilletiopsis washingtonensis]